MPMASSSAASSALRGTHRPPVAAQARKQQVNFLSPFADLGVFTYIRQGDWIKAVGEPAGQRICPSGKLVLVHQLLYLHRLTDVSGAKFGQHVSRRHCPAAR